MMAIKYPTFIKCQEASKDGIPIARLFMACLLMLKDCPPYNESFPDDLFAEVAERAKQHIGT